MNKREGFHHPRPRLFLLLLVFLWPHTAHANTIEVSGEVGVEFRAFTNSPLDTRQHNGNFSAYFQPEFYTAWDDRKQSLTFEPFVRVDQHDDERTHADIRELYWERAARVWELRVGLRKVFWGVTESQHLVDIINQTDLVENTDTEDKLGQPMVNAALIQNWGTVNVFLLPFFRERTFPGEEGRLRTPLVVDTDREVYESGAEDHRLDLAIRWSHYIGAFDFGLAHFSGTGREPTLIPALNGTTPIFLPFYPVIDQTSLDVQATLGGWLLKLEALARSGQGRRFHAVVGGFEYTLVGLFGKNPDLGLLAEYHKDDRDDRATTPFQDDLFLGSRFVLNDTQSTEVLSGVLIDRKRGLASGLIEASRRLGQRWKINLEARGFFEDAPIDPIAALRQDDHIQFDLIYFY